MSKPKKARGTLTKGEFFRIVGPRGVTPDVWTWHGELDGAEGFRIQRTSDNFTMTINPYTLIIPLDLGDL